MLVKPQGDLIVRDPETRQPLPQEGKEVKVDRYWLRRLADGDVVEILPSEGKK
jgi:hypothetical protein